MKSKSFQALLCLWTATALVAAKDWESRIDAMQRYTPESRIDAVQEGYTSVVLAAPSSEPPTVLFADCFTKQRTIQATLQSITIQGTEYIRYVPEAAMITSVNPTFTLAPAAVANIEGCATTAKAQGSKMFKFSAGAVCQLSTNTYNLNTAPACETAKTDAVFVMN